MYKTTHWSILNEAAWRRSPCAGEHSPPLLLDMGLVLIHMLSGHTNVTLEVKIGVTCDASHYMSVETIKYLGTGGGGRGQSRLRYKERNDLNIHTCTCDLGWLPPQIQARRY